jgi:uncharacterized protein with GYD domain
MDRVAAWGTTELTHDCTLRSTDALAPDGQRPASFRSSVGHHVGGGAIAMPKYLALFSYSDTSMAAMIENPADRGTAVERVLESVDARLEALYWMFGAHDGIAIVEAPDSLTMAGISTAIRSTGAVRSETHELFSSADIRQILEHAQHARSNFTAPGQS